MLTSPKYRIVVFLLCLFSLAPLELSALIQVGCGNNPVHDPGWPLGALDVANLKSRVGWWEGPPFGGGQWQFLYQQFTVELGKRAQIGGVVMDTLGKPLADVKVRASSVMAMDGRGYRQPSSQQAVTDEAGRFELTGLPAGFLHLHATAPGYHFGDLFTIYDVPTPNVVLRLGGAGGIRVMVLDKNGKAMSRFEGNKVLVSVEPREGSRIGSWGGSGKVKADGTMEFENVPPGEYRVASRPNPSSTSRRYAAEQIVTVAPGVRADVKVVYE